ncbi:flagellar hook-length control protein FliK [Sphingomonas sp. RB3P16]|uniref:flagellar hook-length control protein FliK n=1 Tax=Parasphingomonas frigoris TaxID=3096163 RepID=UPI002FCACAB3
MIDSPSSLSSAATVMPPPAVLAHKAPSGRFGQTLSAFLDARDATADAAPTPGADRQAVADDGKPLPDPALPDPAEPDPAEPDPDPTLALAAWLPVTPPAVATPTPAQPIATGGATAAATVSPGTPSLPTTPLATPGAPAPTDAPAPPLPPAKADPSLDTLIADALARAPRLEATAGHDVAAPDAPVALASIADAPPAMAVSATPQPAGQLFAAAMAASAWHDRSLQRAEQEPAAPGVLGLAAPIANAERATVLATSDSAGSALDLTQDHGLQKMIDQIATLRDEASDAATARDTRIRLVPDALGSVDVSVRSHGDRVHVHFAAEQEATRALLADAQPRLTELAAARGVRIGDTSVSADSGRGNGAAPQPRPTPSNAPSTTPPPRDTDAATAIPTDARVA